MHGYTTFLVRWLGKTLESAVHVLSLTYPKIIFDIGVSSMFNKVPYCALMTSWSCKV